jgi:mycofactocin biosynthesis protein MftB
VDTPETLDADSIGTVASEAAWRLHPSVAVRPEPFGALLYHYGTRRLTFVKDSTLLRVLSSLAESASVDEAMDACGVGSDIRVRYLTALQRLADTDMLLPADTEEIHA